ncbi:UvrD-helicase domain-containing protein [Sphingomicrobium lutaoense]|uniref:DNA 3'-5' helicase n=1 Tax=Sphingomicrobium lutaoense TaxID=515949 RepID=A0A839YYP9_9SPHN|nr:UvrD-helicase domain-containing protein [Sphingomicrobium lutaoense]MBB3763448.1 hypothetical protein [Sphingomicrobium lutaoense]
MTLLYASTFADSLGKLTHQEQKQAKLTVMDLALDPRGNGLQMHRIDKAEGFWSVRVNRDLRIILHRDGDDDLLAYVDHHDDAYAWAERKRLIPHERTGAMQFVEVPVVQAAEGDDQGSSSYHYPHVDYTALPVAASRPFVSLTDDQLLDVGVPRDWLDIVRDTEEAHVESLFDRLPGEAAEALLDFATGGRIEDHTAPVAPAGSDPYLHPDAQRRFRKVEGLEELKAALEAPFEKWAIFLHPAQRSSVERDWSGPARVSGSAGTGKTIVALHRAAHLAKDVDAKVLLTTFSPALAKNLESKMDLLLEAQKDRRSRVDVRAIDDAARELFEKWIGALRLADLVDARQAIEDAVSRGLGAGHSTDFLLEEWEEVIDAWCVRDVGEYGSIPRIGRKIRLGQNQRESAWEVFAFVRERLIEKGLITWADVYKELGHRVAAGEAFPYSHIVIDEAQDLSVAQAKFLGKLSAAGGNSLFFTGDLGQRIFHLPFSWCRLGIDVRGRSQILKVCYRTSHQIRSAADRLLSGEIVDQDGIVEVRRGTVSVFDGPSPKLELFDNAEDEIAAVIEWVRRRVEEGIAPSEIGILVRDVDQLGRARRATAGYDDVSAIVMHDAKGLEYRAVAVMALDEDVMPSARRLSEVGDVADLEAIHETERHLLYVAATRARDHLHVSGVAPGSEFLDDIGVQV